MAKINNPNVAEVFKTYPAPMRKKLMALRKLVLDTASELEEVADIEETLKWGEPSYLTKSGSTIRIHWKTKKPEQYAMFFNCKSTLVEIFRELYADKFTFEGNRAIVFHADDEVPVDELKHCVSLSLTYHKRKHLPMLGV